MSLCCGDFSPASTVVASSLASHSLNPPPLFRYASVMGKAVYAITVMCNTATIAINGGDFCSVMVSAHHKHNYFTTNFSPEFFRKDSKRIKWSEICSTGSPTNRLNKQKSSQALFLVIHLPVPGNHGRCFLIAVLLFSWFQPKRRKCIHCNVDCYVCQFLFITSFRCFCFTFGINT
jgi:hypothetical protein